ncbi:hypothetical protein SEA_POPPER_46 [Arthrobacter phage Popper]|uniref:Uncharacterized protein n=1 Tax=Arthrobacter phage Popper TaxID=2859633 RepID=A0AAE7WEJ4_9CAUD|nr:hypothetical protein QEO78_gp60 [Arthrobacter phage Popper]QYC54963.1 hypothetical protein SEA_POPPER_46 [Arthrobacter phage Popper]
MTEQPVEPMTEQEFLGNEPHGIAARFAAELGLGARAGAHPTPEMSAPRQAYLPNGHRINAIVHMDLAEAVREELAAAAAELPATPGADLMLTAEQHAQSAVMSLSCGELDEGIAWLQSALAFAQNHRRAEEFERVGK